MLKQYTFFRIVDQQTYYYRYQASYVGPSSSAMMPLLFGASGW